MKPHENTHGEHDFALSPELTFETGYDDTVIATIVEEIVLEKFKDKLEELNKKVVRLRNKSGPAALGRGEPEHDSDPEPLTGSPDSLPTTNGGGGRKPEAEHVNVLNGVQVQVHVEEAPHKNDTTTTNDEAPRTTRSTSLTDAPPEEVLFYKHKVTTTKYASSSSLEHLGLESESNNYGDKSKEIHRELQSTAVYLHEHDHSHQNGEGFQQPFVVVHDSLNEHESATVALNPDLHHEKSASPSPSSTTMTSNHSPRSPSPKKEISPKPPKEKTGYGLAPLSPIAAASVAGANQIFIRYRPKKLASLSSSAASFSDESMSLSKTPSPNRSPSPDPPPPYPYEENEAQTPQPPSKLQRKTLTPSVSVEEIHKEIDRVIQQAEEINTALRGGDGHAHAHGGRAALARRRSSSSDTMLDAFDSESVEVETVESETHEIDALEPDPNDHQQQHGEVPLAEFQPTGDSTSSASATPPREKSTVEVIIRMVKVTTRKEETRVRDKRATREGSTNDGSSNGDGGDDDRDDGTSVDPPAPAPAPPSGPSSSIVQHTHPRDSGAPAAIHALREPLSPIMTDAKEPPPQPQESEPAAAVPLTVKVTAPTTKSYPVTNRSDDVHEVRVLEPEQVQFVTETTIPTPAPMSMPVAVPVPVDIIEPAEPETRVEALKDVGEHKVEHGPVEAPVVVQSRFVKKYATVAAEVHAPKSEPPSVLMTVEPKEQIISKVKELIQSFQSQPLAEQLLAKANSPAISNDKNMKSTTKPTKDNDKSTTTTGATKGLLKSAQGRCPEPTIFVPTIKETPTPKLSQQSPSKTDKKQPVEQKTPAQKEATSEARVTVTMPKVPASTPSTFMPTPPAAPSVSVCMPASTPVVTPTLGTPKSKSKKKKGNNDTAHAAHDADNNNHVEAKPAPKPNSSGPSPTKAVSPPLTSTSTPSNPSCVKKRVTDSNTNSKPTSPSSSKANHNSKSSSSKSQSKNSSAVAVARGRGPAPLSVTGTLPVPSRGSLLALISDGLILAIELILCLVFIAICFTYARGGHEDLAPIGWLSLSVLFVGSLISNTRLEDQFFNLIRRPGARGSRNFTSTWTSTLVRWGTRTLHPLIWIGMQFKAALRYRLHTQDAAARSEFASVSHLYREHIAQDSIRLIVRFCIVMQVVGLSIYMCRSGHAVCYGPKAGDDGTLFSVQLATAFASGLAAARWTWRLFNL